MGLPSRQLLDDFDRLIVQVLRNPVRARVFYGTISPDQMVKLASVIGISLTTEQFFELLTTDTGRYWFFGSKTKDPFAHLHCVFGL